jgi:hypothetical protein
MSIAWGPVILPILVAVTVALWAAAALHRDGLPPMEKVDRVVRFPALPYGKIPFYSPAMTDQVRASEPPPPGESATTAETAPRRRAGLLRTRTFGRWTARLLSLLGIALIILGLTGWWLTTRVLDDEGFGDVVAKSVQQQAVRNYIGDQATLQLARSNKLITAARPCGGQGDR